MLIENEFLCTETTIIINNTPVILYGGECKDGLYYIHYTVVDESNDTTKYMFTCFQDERKCDLYYQHMISNPQDLSLEKSWDTWFDSLKFKEYSTLEYINRNYEASKSQRF
jgi:hypothetical protein